MFMYPTYINGKSSTCIVNNYIANDILSGDVREKTFCDVALSAATEKTTQTVYLIKKDALKENIILS